MTEFAGGIQYHFSRSLSRAAIPGTNMIQYLAGVLDRTLDPIDAALELRARQLVHDIETRAQAAEAAHDHFRQSDPGAWEACHYGLAPWPDEPGVAADFTPICHCQRRCLFHDTKAPWAEPVDCNCEDKCPRHGEKVVDHDVGPLPKPDPEINPRHYGMPYRPSR
jgi:hypothetical protein